jgi:ribosomal protein S18 acetylase RimI-like enzyme
MAQRGENAWEVGRSRAIREEGGFSYRNSIIAELDGNSIGCLIGYALAKEPEQIDYSSVPPLFVPLEELEQLASNTWYINVVAVNPEFRGQGVGSRLLERAEQAALETDKPGLSLFVADANVGARRLNTRADYNEIAKKPIVKEQWRTEAQRQLLTRNHLERDSEAMPHCWNKYILVKAFRLPKRVCG